MRLLICTLAGVCLLTAQTRQQGSTTTLAGSTIDNTLAAPAALQPLVSTLPSTCDATKKPTVRLTSDNKVYVCATTNTWTVETGSSSGSSLPSGTGLVKVTSGTGALAISGTDYYLPGAGLPISDITGLTAALSGKAPTSHTHAISDVTGLQAALNAGATFRGRLTTAPTTSSATNLEFYIDSATEFLYQSTGVSGQWQKSGCCSLVAGTGISITQASNGTYTVALANTAVTPGSYTNLNATIDAQGRITAASNGTGGSGGTTLPDPTGNAGKAVISNGTTYVLGGTLNTCNTLTLGYTSLIAASPSQNVTFFTMPQGAILSSVFIKEQTQFASSIGTITAIKVSIGRAGSETEYAPQFSLMQAVADTNLYADVGSRSAQYTSHAVVARFSVTNTNPGNLGNGTSSNLTAGSVLLKACYIVP